MYVGQLKFELCEDSVSKKAASASDNKTSGFSTRSLLCHNAVAGPLGLKKPMQQSDFTLSEVNLMMPFSQLFIVLFALKLDINI